MPEVLSDLVQAGDAEAFAALVQPLHGELHRHCYRMLGSVVDADDVVQETLVAAWRGLEGFAGRSSLRTWLHQIATNRCLNAIRDGKRRPPPVPVPPFEPPVPTRHTEVTWLQPYPDIWLDASPGPVDLLGSRDSVRLAFVAALQELQPRQCAALLLYEVLGFSLGEVADMLGTTPAAAKGLVQRARRGLQRLGPGARALATQPGSPAEADVARRFAEAFSADDVDAVVAVLTDDAWLRMPPAPHEYQGKGPIAEFLRASSAGRAGRRLSLVPTRANGQPAFLCYIGGSADQRPCPSGIVALEVAGGRVAVITRFLDRALPAVFARQGPPR